MYGFGGVGLSEVQLSISELSVVGGWWVVGGAQTHFMVGPSQGPTKRQRTFYISKSKRILIMLQNHHNIKQIRKTNKAVLVVI